MKHEVAPVFNGVCYLLTAVQTNEIFETISFCLTIITSVVIIGKKIYDWYVDAKKDGKITKDEVKDIIEDVTPDVKEIIDKVKEK